MVMPVHNVTGNQKDCFIGVSWGPYQYKDQGLKL